MSRQQDNGDHGYCEPINACGGIDNDGYEKRQYDLLNLDLDLNGNTGYLEVKRQQDNGDHGYCEPLGICGDILVKRQGSISGSPLSNPPVDDPLNSDPDLWGDQGGMPPKRQQDNGDGGHYCEPINACGDIPTKRGLESTGGGDFTDPEDAITDRPMFWSEAEGLLKEDDLVKRDDPDDCNPKSECGGPMGMRPDGPPA